MSQVLSFKFWVLSKQTIIGEYCLLSTSPHHLELYALLGF